MAKSTALITDATSVVTNGPAAASQVKANAAGGPLMDYQGNSKLLLLKFQESTVLLAKVLTDTDASDPNLATLQGVQALLLGTSSPSTQALTDIKAVYTAGPTAATTALATAAGGPLMDYKGNVKAIQRKLEEANVQCGSSTVAYPSGLIQVTDAGDANLALLARIANVLV